MSDYPGVPFRQAAGYTRGRPDGPPLWWVLHTAEAPERDTTAEAVAGYFANPGDGRQVSAHLCIDNDSAVQCVRLSDSAWTVGNRPGNYRGVNVELAGYASQGTAGWQDAYSQAMLRRAAKLAAIDVRRYGIPVRFCTVDQLQARQKGFTTHNDLRLAFGGTSHTDPGAAFPKAQFLDFVQTTLNGDDDMTPGESWALHVINYRVEAIKANRPVIRVPARPDLGSSYKAFEEPNLLAVAVGADQVDERAIIAGVLAGLSPEAIAAAIPTDLAQRVADELAARLAE